MKEWKRRLRKFVCEEGNFDDWLNDQIEKISEDDNKCEISNLDQLKKELNKISKNLDCLPQNYVKHFKQHLKDIRKNHIKSHYMSKEQLYNHVSNLSLIIKKLKEKQNENYKCN